MIKLSIIVPVYNVEKYLSRCLESLVNQTLKDIEIIIVNDGTKDRCQDIIDKYKTKYPQIIKSFIKENGGLSSARNYGLKYSKGEYIAFVDSDDWVAVDMFEKMYKKAKSTNFDIVVCNLIYQYNSKSVYATSRLTKDLLNSEEIKKSMIDIYPAAWNKIYHKRLFKDKIEFKEKIWFEDVEFLYRLFPRINSIGIVDEYLYNYVQREGAITSTFDFRLFDYINNWNGIVDYYKKNNIFNIYKNELEFCYVRYLYATFIKSVCRSKNKKMYNQAINTALYNVKNNFPNYKKNKYFYKNLKGIYCLIFNKFFAKILYYILNR